MIALWVVYNWLALLCCLLCAVISLLYLFLCLWGLFSDECKLFLRKSLVFLLCDSVVKTFKLLFTLLKLISWHRVWVICHILSQLSVFSKQTIKILFHLLLICSKFFPSLKFWDDFLKLFLEILIDKFEIFLRVFLLALLFGLFLFDLHPLLFLLLLFNLYLLQSLLRFLI